MKDFIKENWAVLLITIALIAAFSTLCYSAIQHIGEDESQRMEYFTKELGWSKARYRVCNLRSDCNLFNNVDEQVRFEEWKEKHYPKD